MQGLRRCPQVPEGFLGIPPRFPVGPAAAELARLLRELRHSPRAWGTLWPRVDALRECLLPPPGAWCSHGTSAPSAPRTEQAAGLSPGPARVSVRWLARGLHQRLLLLSPGRGTHVAGVQASPHTDGLSSDPGKKTSRVYESPGRALAAVAGADLRQIPPYGTRGSAAGCAGLASPWGAQVLGSALPALDESRCRAGLRGQRGLRSCALEELRPWTGPRV